ncbi:MAG TPA: A24 family peptidase [Rhodocyclaceae bacterium]|nr:A24 family peptidase [Rhodocyclaceae bacterium]
MLDFWCFAALLLGLMIGSFLNVVIHRLPKMMERDWAEQCAELRNEEPVDTPRYNLAVPRSACPHCAHQITALENIPLVSWIVLRGKCSSCKAPISPRYPIIEGLTGLLFAFSIWHFGPTWQAASAMFFIAALIALAMIDFDTTLLPDDITLPLLWAGLLVNLIPTTSYTSLPSAVIGAMAGYLILWLVYWAFKLLTGKEGMGYGDFKLLAALGAWLGWKLLPIIVLLSSCVGAVIGIALVVFAKRGRDVPIPFGPYLAAAGVIALFYGGQLNQLFPHL